MPFFWNDETFWDRIKFQNKKDNKITIPIFLGISLLLYAFVKITLLETIFIAMFFSFSIVSFVDMFVQAPHFRIPDTYSSQIRTILYILNFLIAILGLYVSSISILQHQYPFFESLVCCDLIKNLKL